MSDNVQRVEDAEAVLLDPDQVTMTSDTDASDAGAVEEIPPATPAEQEPVVPQGIDMPDATLASEPPTQSPDASDSSTETPAASVGEYESASVAQTAPKSGPAHAAPRADIAARLPEVGAAADTLESAEAAQAGDIPVEPVRGDFGMAPASMVMPGDNKPKRKFPFVPILIVAALIGAAYVAGSLYFSSVFFPNTTLNGKDVSLRSQEEVAAENSASISEFSFLLTGDNINRTITAADIKASYDGERFAQEAIDHQDPWKWPAELMKEHVLTVESGMSYDSTLIETIVTQAVDAVNADAKESKNATAVFDEGTSRYKINPEEQGTVIDKALVLDAVYKAIEIDQPKVELDDSYYLKPTITQDNPDLVAAVDKVNACLGATQDLVTHDQTVYTVSEGDIKNWVRLADDQSVSFDKEACVTWARGTLSEKLDSRGSTRNYTRPDGKQISVSSGTYGWVIDGAAIADKIAENVQAGNKGTIDLVFSQEAAEWNPGGKDWGDYYVDIDLSEQHVRLYQGSDVIWESDCVSGGLNQGKTHFTPTGVYYINDNMTSGNVELRGEIDPATNQPEYISYVTYWMTFIENSVALHDADWRGSFGGDIYLSNGSHGCVNLPPDAAASLYGLVSVGTPVVVHD